MPTYEITLNPGETVLVTAPVVPSPPPPPPEFTTMKVLKGNGAPENGVTGAGITDRGDWYLDRDTGFQYSNVGTLESPEWHGVLTA
jgi:hypothetical protein